VIGHLYEHSFGCEFHEPVVVLTLGHAAGSATLVECRAGPAGPCRSAPTHSGDVALSPLIKRF